MRVLSGNMRSRVPIRNALRYTVETSHSSALPLNLIVFCSSVGARPELIPDKICNYFEHHPICSYLFQHRFPPDLFLKNYIEETKGNIACSTHSGFEGAGERFRVHLLWQWQRFLFFICSILGASNRERANECSCEAFVFLLEALNTGPSFVTLCPRKMESYLASAFSVLLRCSPKEEKNTRE